MKTETVYNVLEKVDRSPILTGKVTSVMVYLAVDRHSAKESIEFQKGSGIPYWAESIKRSVSGNKPLNNILKTCPVLDTNIGAVKLGITSRLEIVVISSPDQEPEPDDREENTEVDNQQLSKDNSSIESCNMALTVEDLKTFLSIIQSDTKIFATDGKRIFPITSLSILKRDEGEDDMIAVFGELNRNLVFESSTTRDNPVDVK